MSRRVMIQGVLYSAALLIQTIVLGTLALRIPAIHTSFSIRYLAAITLPLQGFLNVLIYMIPNFKKWVEKMRCKSRQNLTTTTQQNTPNKECQRGITNAQVQTGGNVQFVEEEMKVEESDIEAKSNLMQSPGVEEHKEVFFSPLEINYVDNKDNCDKNYNKRDVDDYLSMLED